MRCAAAMPGVSRSPRRHRAPGVVPRKRLVAVSACESGSKVPSAGFCDPGPTASSGPSPGVSGRAFPRAASPPLRGPSGEPGGAGVVGQSEARHRLGAIAVEVMLGESSTPPEVAAAVIQAGSVALLPLPRLPLWVDPRKPEGFAVVGTRNGGPSCASLELEPEGAPNILWACAATMSFQAWPGSPPPATPLAHSNSSAHSAGWAPGGD